MIKMTTVTYNEEIIPEFFGEPIQISLTIPTKQPDPSTKNKVPITVFLSKTGGNSRFGAYVYSIYDFKNGSDIHTTTLNSSNEDLLEFTTRLLKIISSKFACPSYVSASGHVSLEESISYIKLVVNLIKDKYEK